MIRHDESTARLNALIADQELLLNVIRDKKAELRADFPISDKTLPAKGGQWYGCCLFC